MNQEGQGVLVVMFLLLITVIILASFVFLVWFPSSDIENQPFIDKACGEHNLKSGKLKYIPTVLVPLECFPCLKKINGILVDVHVVDNLVYEGECFE